ncbi:MAG TPA: matrixin family metalloprotease [Polyangiaceae bacterium]|nr:matrixin family metalloprotease [Polyangiaceae bacterium]
MNARLLLVVPAVLGALATAPNAVAYCVERTCGGVDADETCEYDEVGCVATGANLHWVSSCLSFDVQVDGSLKSGIDADQATEVTERAFAAWQKADCNGAHPSLKIGTFGAVACDESRYNENGKNANVIVFRDDDWPYPGGQDTFGQTMVRFDTKTGEIYDADVEINSFDFDVTTDGDADGADLQSILTHEIGHFLGLAHTQSDEADATMRAGWDGHGVDLRTLTSDDEGGICALYPPDRKASESCEPRHGFSGQCFEPIPAPAKPSCSSTARPVSSGVGRVALSGLVAVTLFRRRAARKPGAGRRR